MQSTIFRGPGGLALACALLAPSLAQTQDPGSTAARAGFSKPVAVAELGNYRGGSQFVHNDITLAGTTADNSAQQVTTGNNAISSGAFANMSGIPVVIQNSGANVLIQNAVILHLQID
nr:hypothetical protein [uncultured Albidiferax sp.]